VPGDPEQPDPRRSARRIEAPDRRQRGRERLGREVRGEVRRARGRTEEPEHRPLSAFVELAERRAIAL